MPEPDHQPDLSGRQGAHRVVDFLWDRVHISSGALVLIIVSMCFTIAVYKISHDQINQLATVNHGVCHVVNGANHNVGAARERIQGAITRFQQQAHAQDQIVSVWKYAARQAQDKHGHALAERLINANHKLAQIDRQSAADLQKQLDGVKTIQISGCQ